VHFQPQEEHQCPAQIGSPSEGVSLAGLTAAILAMKINLTQAFSLVRQLKCAILIFVVGQKIMSHYFKIIQEIMVFGKSTMICVS